MKKKFYESKAIWGGLLTAVVAPGLLLLGQLMQGQVEFGSFLQQAIPLVGMGLGVIGIRHAQG